ncbi:MAG TPA: hypothetical protein VGR35_19450 [Tepidisphaeraceae bacterium]|nr:hypothetical protein [Tepidisphaeraceae bacterium]
MKRAFRLVAALIVVLITFGLAHHAEAQVARRVAGPGAVAAGGMVNLPYPVSDNAGNQWFVYQGGWLQQQGNNQIYSQGAQLQINGQQPSGRNNQARLDEKTGEVIFENMNAQALQVTRRILPMRDEGAMRYIDIIKNPQGNDVPVTITIQSNINYGVQNAEMVSDPRRKGQNLAWVAQTHHNNRTAVEVYAGKGAKQAPTINWQQGNNVVNGSLQTTIPANSEIAIMHLHATAASQQAGVDWVNGLKESALLKTIPPDLRKIIVNFVTGQSFIGDRELLRGDLFDVIELRGGDQMKGTLKEPSYKLETFYGTVELPVERVIALMNVGDFRPRQLIVTVDGEIFGGKLTKDTLAMELSSGQTTQVPLSQVTRAGYRKRPNEPEEWKFDKPFMMMRSGDRVAITMPEQPIEVITRYGAMKLDPKTIAAIVFQSEEHGVHEVRLIDGSRFAGLVSANAFDMALAGAGPERQVVKFPVSGISRMQFVAEPPELDEDTTPMLRLSNQDMLVGTITAQLKLDTAFDTLTLEGGQVRKLAHASDAGLDVQVTLWDQSIVSGQLQEPQVQVALKSGLVLSVPVALIEEYDHPEPQPSSAMVDKIKEIVGRLNAEDWKDRDRAAAQLTEMGPIVAPVLKSMRDAQPPEAQQRIDQVLSAVAGSKGASALGR